MKKVAIVLAAILVAAVLIFYAYNIFSFFALLCSNQKASTILPLLQQRLFILFIFGFLSAILGWAGKACLLFFANKARTKKNK